MLYITNIQRYTLHDGGGIRTTVFFKGCPLHCAWCHNPETLSFTADVQTLKYTPQTLAQIVLRDQIFWGETGGVTLSGGEPLAQDLRFMVDFLRILKAHDVHIAIDTCGAAAWEHINQVLPYTDLFLYDFKLASDEAHKAFTGCGNALILNNLRALDTTINKKTPQHSKPPALFDEHPDDPVLRKDLQLWLRIPVVGGVNDSDQEMHAMIDTIKNINIPADIYLLPYHNMGAHKWGNTHVPAVAANFYTPTPERMNIIKNMWQASGLSVIIGGH